MNIFASICQFLFLNSNHSYSIFKAILLIIIIDVLLLYWQCCGYKNMSFKDKIAYIWDDGLWLSNLIIPSLIMIIVIPIMLSWCQAKESLKADPDIKLVRLVKTNNFAVNNANEYTYRNKKHHPVTIKVDDDHVFKQTKFTSIKNKPKQIEIYKAFNTHYMSKAQKIFKGTSVPTNSELTKYNFKPLKKKNGKYMFNEKYWAFSFSPKEKHVVVVTNYKYLK